MKRLSLTALLMIVLLGGLARFYHLDEKSLWSDEIATIATSMGNSIDPDAYTLRHQSFDPPQPVPANSYWQKASQSHGLGNFNATTAVLKFNVHPPLFFWLMNLWCHFFGLTPWALRIPAVLFGLMGLPVMYGLALQLMRLNGDSFTQGQRQAFALLTTAMLAISAYQVDHAQDARQYTLLILLALISAWLATGLLQTLQTDRRRSLLWLGLAFSLSAGLYTQYFFGLFIGFILVYLGWKGRYHRSFLLGLGITVGLIGLLFFFCWLPVFREQLFFLKSAGHYTAGLWRPLQLPEKLWRILCEFFLPHSPFGKIIPIFLLLIPIRAALFSKRSKGSPLRIFTFRALIFDISPALTFILFWLIVIIGGQIGIDLIKQTHTATIRRYLLLASPAVYLLAAYALITLGKSLQKPKGLILQGILSFLLMAFMVGDTVTMLTKRHTSSDEFRQAAQWINRSAGSHDLVLVNKTGAMAVGMSYYLKPETPMLGLHVPDYQTLTNDRPLMRQLENNLMGQRMPQRKVWLVFSHAAPSTRKRLDAWLSARHFEITAHQKFPGVQVYTYNHLN